MLSAMETRPPTFILVPAPGELNFEDPAELLMELGRWRDLLQVKALPPIEGYAFPLYLGPNGEIEGLLKAATTLTVPLATAVGAWLHARYGRKARIKIGDIEVEAQTGKEVEQLLERAQDFKNRNEPKKIHEP
jgi:hypothetical protein